MRRQIRRLWQLGRGQAAVVPSVAPSAISDTPADELALPQPVGPVSEMAAPLEQPVLLTPAGAARTARIGELLPARRQPWPLAVIRLPVVPKRAILAAGVCAGLAAPQIAKHLATRMLLGNSGPTTRAGVEGVLEITRIVYNGPLTPHVADAITKALSAGRR